MPAPLPRPERRVLVIRLGALGDFVLSFGPFQAIRRAHPNAEISLLTTAPFVDLARLSGWFDQVVVDDRPRWWQVPAIVRLAGQLRGFDMVFDLQTSRRSNAYFRLAGRPPWSGIAAGCSAPHSNRERDTMHTLARQAEQLAMAGIAEAPPPDLSWLLHADAPAVPPPFALLVPGAARHRPQKRWPVAGFAALAAVLQRRGVTPAVVGSDADAPLGAAIRAVCPQALDLTGRTDLPGLGLLARRAALAVGNDTGPMHLAAAVGCPCVVLFGGASDPALTAPPGATVLRAADLADLAVERVAAALPLTA